MRILLSALSLTGCLVSGWAQAESEFYAFNCTETSFPSGTDLEEAYRDLGIERDGGFSLISILKKENFYGTYINDVLYVVALKDRYEENKDTSRIMTFPFACSFFSIYQLDLGKDALKANLDSVFQLPEHATLLEPIP